MNKILISLLVIFTVGAVQAVPLYCRGKIKNSFIEQNGNIHIYGSWRSQWTRICSTKDLDKVLCSLWTSYIVNAIENNLDVTVNYNVNEGVTCANLPKYSEAPRPNYIMLHNAQ